MLLKFKEKQEDGAESSINPLHGVKAVSGTIHEPPKNAESSAEIFKSTSASESGEGSEAIPDECHSVLESEVGKVCVVASATLDDMLCSEEPTRVCECTESLFREG